MYTDYTQLLWTKVYTDHLLSKKLTESDQAILILLCFKTYKHNRLIVISPADLERYSGYSARTVRRCIERIIEAGIITEEKSRNQNLRVFHLIAPLSETFIKVYRDYHLDPSVPWKEKLVLALLQTHRVSPSKYYWLTHGQGGSTGLVRQCHLSRWVNKKAPQFTKPNPTQELKDLQASLVARGIIKKLMPHIPKNPHTESGVPETVDIDFDALEKHQNIGTPVLPLVQQDSPTVEVPKDCCHFDPVFKAHYSEVELSRDLPDLRQKGEPVFQWYVLKYYPELRKQYQDFDNYHEYDRNNLEPHIERQIKDSYPIWYSHFLKKAQEDWQKAA